MKKVLNVTKVAFHGQTGDDRAPESFAFPACMASMMEALGEDWGTVTLHAHNRRYTKRLANEQFLSASGMAFGLLWHPEHCMSAMDLMQVTDHTEAIRRAFQWAGHAYELIECGANADDHAVREKIVRSIDAGVPVLAFGLFDPPECALVAGYDKDGAALIGWSHFQDYAGLPTESNGMFRLEPWTNNWWVIVIPGAKTGRSLSYEDALAHGLSIMEKTKIEGYAAGQAAYEAWIDDILSLAGADEETLKARFHYHHCLLFNLAEARTWGSDFLRDAGAQEAADCFLKICDLCWEADAVTGGSNGWAALGSAAKREKVTQVLRRIQSLDQKAADSLRVYLHA